MSTEIVVKFSGSLSVQGTGPVVLLGANGAGKTRLGAKLVSLNSGATRVPPHRSLILQGGVTPFEAAERLSGQRNQQTNYPWQLAGDFDSIYAKMYGETAGEHLRWERAREVDPAAEPPSSTRIFRVDRLWRSMLPSRQLEFDGPVQATSNFGGGAPKSYPAAQMSDGERTALYLAMSARDAKPGVVIVDEPTIHLHPELARRLWNLIEAERPDCRFVYITHDMDFTLSRRNVRILVKRPGGADPVLVPQGESIPKDVLHAVLGLYRQALERTKRALRHRLAAVLDNVKPAADLAQVQDRLREAIQPQGWSFDPREVLKTELARLESGLMGDWDTQLLPLFPGKDILGATADTLGVKTDVYKETVLSALRGTREHSPIQSDIIAALAPHLPPRKAT